MLNHRGKLFLSPFLMVAFINTATAQWWNPFKPKDYEECAAAAAKDSKTENALKILLQNCATKFKARRNKKGAGYLYRDETGQGYLVDGPNPTSSEWKWIQSEQEKSRNKQRKAAEERRQKIQLAKQKISLHDKDIICELNCWRQRISATVKNNSDLTITSITLGWLVREPDPNNRMCPRSYDTQRMSFIKIPPGSNGHVSMTAILRGFKINSSQIAYCIGIEDVEFEY